MEFSAHYFKGIWQLQRLSTRLDNPEQLASFVGQASFMMSPDNPAQLDCTEQGLMHIPNSMQPLEATKQWLYQFDIAQPNEFSVLYADGPQSGQLYQTYLYNPATGRVEQAADHECGPDCYSSFYMFLDDNHFQLHTIVRGPRKGYQLLGDYRRL